MMMTIRKKRAIPIMLVSDGSRSLPLHPHDGDDRSDEGGKAQPDEPAHKSTFRQDESACRKTPLSLTTIISRRSSDWRGVSGGRFRLRLRLCTSKSFP